ncbi:molybdopterin oxidoreductase family protein [Curvibacter sp. CHRR-16]|uniref:molybdopterin-containing oxidoreductase family protein n=1 Tax=Curvibacter sp. CHRR-16 TaxID=2835872 RepID=UPI001BDA98E2|nr:molybdopterin oxidoreductase family protein [Curvibacter sp. CHRR-16]MBT0569813.1 molybdopterin oxidoreductase family protein [Curvibacter sp. CHRR-16]
MTHASSQLADSPTAVTAASDSTHTVLGACPHDCPDTCSMVVTVQGGKAIKVQGNPAHPTTGGVLCTKVSRYTERTYHPERLQYPQKRVGPKGPGQGAGQFVRVSWEEAIHDIAQRLQAIAASPAGPQAILPYNYAGTMGRVQGGSMASRFFHKLGASQLEATICASAGAEALNLTYGSRWGMHMPYFAESSLILIWGSNAIGSNLHFWRYVMEAKRNGAKLVCIDPRRTETADKCHEHIALLPGTDAALALGLMQQLIVNDWLDHDYLQRHTEGWDALRTHALQWTPERVAATCGIRAEQVVQLAADYGACRHSAQALGTGHAEKHAAIRVNYGVQRTHGGGNAVRAIACLPALIGAWRHRAGGLLLSSSGFAPPLNPALEGAHLAPATPRRSINMSCIGDALDPLSTNPPSPALQAVVVYNSNPVAVAPDSARVKRGFAREDLFTVVLEHFQTDTADYADYLLPATTQLEHWDIHTSYGHTDVLLNRPSIAPVGEALPNTEIFRRLARAMGFTEPCFADSDEALCRMAYDGRVDFDALLEHGFVHQDLPEAPFAQGGFPTPSGKCQFVSPALVGPGNDGLPHYLPLREEPHPANAEGASGGTSPQYPLRMISPPARNFLNSTFVNVQSLRKSEGEPLVEIHPHDAAARGIQTGDVVNVFNQRGSYRVRAEVSERARPGVVVCLGIWWHKDSLEGHNINILTSQAVTDLGNGATFYDCGVEVGKA